MIDRDPPRGSGSGGRNGPAGALLRFGKAFLRDPGMLGSIVPSSRFLVRRALRPIEWERADLVVEYGPGVGTLTREILRRLRPDARLLVFETHPDFVAHLRGTLHDPRLEVIHGSAEGIKEALRGRELEGADYVLSGIPFSLMPEEARDAILENTRAVLDPEGAMLVYQFSPTIGTHLRRVFDQVSWEFEPRNILPAVVFRCRMADGEEPSAVRS